MGSIINDFQTILISNLLNPLCITWRPIHMHWHDRSCLVGNRCLDLIRIHVSSCRIHIHKHRFAAIPPNTMSCSDKTVRSSDDFTSYAQSLQRSQQRQSSVCEQTDVWNLKILCKFLFQLLVKRAVVCDPFTIPYLLE